MLFHLFFISKGVDATEPTQVLKHTLVVLINVVLHLFPCFELLRTRPTPALLMIRAVHLQMLSQILAQSRWKL